MPLPTKFKTIPFVSGIDTKTDDKAVQGKLLTCKNLVFSSPGVVKKRNSFKEYDYTPQDTDYQVQSTSFLQAKKETLLSCHDIKHYRSNVGSFSHDENSGPYLCRSISTDGTDIDHQLLGIYKPMKATSVSVTNGLGYAEPNMALSSDYVAYAWHETDGEATPNHNILLTIRDRSTDMVLLNSYNIHTNTGISLYQTKVFLVDGSVYVFYVDTNLICTKYVISTATESASNIATDLHADEILDICLSEYSSADSFAIAYKESSSGDLKVIQVSQAMGILDSDTGASGILDKICIFQDSSRNELVIGYVDSAGSFYSTTTPEASITLAAGKYIDNTPSTNTLNHIAGIKNPEVIADERNRAGSPPPVLTSSYYWYLDLNNGTGSNFVKCFFQNQPTTEKVVEYTWGNATILTKPFVHNNKIFIGLGIESDTQGSLNICCLTWDTDRTSTSHRREQSTVAQIYNSFLTGQTDTLAQICIESESVNFIVSRSTSDAGIRALSDIRLLMGVVTGNITQFGNNYMSIMAGKPSMASSFNCVDIGFCAYPEIGTITTSTINGYMSDGTYNIVVTYEYIDNGGNIHRSAPTPDIETVVLSGGGSNQSIVVPMYPLGFGSLEKTINSSISVYRTINNGTTYYLAATRQNYRDSAGYVSVVLAMSDADLQGQTQLYTASGSILDNIPPPMSNIALKTYDRIYMVDSLRPSEIWFSKPLRAEVAPEFNDSFVITISGGGDIVGLVDMRGSVVVIKEDAVYVFSGKGPGADGRGAFGQPQLVSNRGCISSESILQTDHGVYYQAENGIYLLAMDLSVKYVGGQVEDYNSHTVVNAVHMQDQNQARFLLDDADNTILVHDYQMNQWATFTDANFAWSTGQSANWDDKHIMCNALATCYLEDPTTITSELFELTTEWIQMADWDGFQRIREVHTIGTYKNNHMLSMTSTRDYDDSKTESKYWVVSSDPGTYSLRTKPKYQKCRAMKYKLTDGPNSTNVVDIGGMTEQSTVRTLNGTISISPYTNLYDLVGSAANARHHLANPSGYATISGQYYCVSVLAKKGNKNWIVVRSTGADALAFFDLDSIAIGYTEGNEYDNSFVVDAGSGYVFCIVVVLSNGLNITPSLWSAEVDNDFYFIGDAVTVNTSVSRLYVEQGHIPSALGDSVELNGLRIGYGVKRALAKSRSSST